MQVRDRGTLVPRTPNQQGRYSYRPRQDQESEAFSPAANSNTATRIPGISLVLSSVHPELFEDRESAEPNAKEEYSLRMEARATRCFQVSKEVSNHVPDSR